MIKTSIFMTSSLHLRADREHLLSAISAADAVVPSTASKPILTNLQLDAKATHVEITASDGQVGLRSLVRRVEILGQGQVVVNSRQLVSILRESQSTTVELHHQGGGEQSQLAIRLADGDYQVPAVVGEAFPSVSFFPTDVVPFHVPGKRLAEMLRKSTFAMDKERTSPTLSGLSLTVGNGELIIAATDGKVLAETVETGENLRLAAEGEMMAVVVPAPAVGHLQRILGTGTNDKVEFAFAGRLLFLRLAVAEGLQVELTARLVDGTFPSYRPALANATGQIGLTFHTGQLASAVRRVALMTQTASRSIILHIDRDTAILSNMNSLQGSARIPIPCQYQGQVTRYGLNADYLQNILKVYEGEHIGIEISRGLIMREPGVTYLVMPISLPI